jgi:DNA-binding GntR family transcriptional regulator
MPFSISIVYDRYVTIRRLKSTLSEEVFDSIRAELLRGNLKPGSKLRMSDFTARYRVSASVVREALTRLAEQGLVTASPQRGFTVMSLSVEDLLDLTRARTLIETMALREAIADGDLSWESGVIAAHHTLERTEFLTSEGHVSEEWAEAHRKFHHCLLAGCKSTRLTAVATGLRECAELYLHWSRELAHDENRDVAAEHKLIADRAVARDSDAASGALGDHIERTTAILVAYATEQSEEARDEASA